MTHIHDNTCNPISERVSNQSLISTIVPDSLVIHYWIYKFFLLFCLKKSIYWSVQSLCSNRNEHLFCKLAQFYSNATLIFMHFSRDLAWFRYMMLINLSIINEGSKSTLNVKLIHKQERLYWQFDGIPSSIECCSTNDIYVLAFLI